MASQTFELPTGGPAAAPARVNRWQELWDNLFGERSIFSNNGDNGLFARSSAANALPVQQRLPNATIPAPEPLPGVPQQGDELVSAVGWAADGKGAIGRRLCERLLASGLQAQALARSLKAIDAGGAASGVPSNWHGSSRGQLGALVIQVRARQWLAKQELCRRCNAHSAKVIQSAVREHQAASRPGSRLAAIAYADSFLPRNAEGELFSLCETVPFDVYDRMGLNIGLYMRFVWRIACVFGLLCTIAWVPCTINLAGGRFKTLNFGETQWSTWHTLGNAHEVHWAQGASDALICAILILTVLRMSREFERHEEALRSELSEDDLNASHYTLRVSGLPQDVGGDSHLPQIRAFFSRWGLVVSVALSRQVPHHWHARLTPLLPHN